MKAIAREAITVSSTAIGFTESVLVAPRRGSMDEIVRAEFVVETDDIRFTQNGTVPTSSVGTPAYVGDVIVIEAPNIEAFRAIRVTNNAAIDVTYFARR